VEWSSQSSGLSPAPSTHSIASLLFQDQESPVVSAAMFHSRNLTIVEGLLRSLERHGLQNKDGWF
jgi:hypothetical protein